MLTLNTRRNILVFTDADIVDECRDELLKAADMYGFHVLAYCFMPDHLHLLAEGSESSRLVVFIQRFKQVTGYRFKRRSGHQQWQRSFYDHVLRSEEDIRDVAAYIWNNPGAGLVEDRNDYPFSGPIGQT